MRKGSEGWRVCPGFTRRDDEAIGDVSGLECSWGSSSVGRLEPGASTAGTRGPVEIHCVGLQVIRVEKCSGLLGKSIVLVFSYSMGSIAVANAPNCKARWVQ
jgi:hypothetical protein